MTTTAQASILIVDDHTVVREGLKMLLNTQADLHIVGEAADGNTAIRLATELHPDLILIDLALRGLHGVATTLQLRTAVPNSRILAYTVHEEPDIVKEMMEAGASGYVLKRSSAEELLQAVRTVAQGGVYLDSAVAGGVVRSIPRTSADSTPALSARETEVLRLLAAGNTNKDIAASLSVSVKTVETYKARIMTKLNIHRRADMVRYAARRGWLLDL